MFTQQEKKDIEALFIQAKSRFEGKKDAFFEVIKKCNEEEKICLWHLYSFMPTSDIADYDGELILKFVKHAIKVKSKCVWGETIPTEIFLHYILSYRVNNENIEDYRELFFEELYQRVEGKTMKEAALEVNYWCLQKAVYKSTDSRTASPLTVIRNGYGRCGEESTLLVSALRSVGIPARQCYVPRWAHCDDNHAWVEVWADGKWHYMGACEPEPILDTGWFDLASSKAMLTQAKVFGKYQLTEEVMEQTAITSIVNTLDHYAATKTLKVKVIDDKGKGLENVKVRFELLNYSELYPVATSLTNKQGEVTLKTGFGDIMIHAVKDCRFYTQKVDLRKQDELIIEWHKAVSVESGIVDFEMVPPLIDTIPEKLKSDKQNSLHEEKLQRAHAIRKAYESTFYTEEMAREFAKDYTPYEKEVASFLVKSRGNYEVIIHYLKNHQEIPLKYKVGVLNTLKLKDYTDITLEVLVAHVEDSWCYKDNVTETMFNEEIVAPRIHIEMLSAYKKGILEYFTPSEIEKFRDNPEKIMSYIKGCIASCKDEDYDTLYATPLGTLAIQKGSLRAKHILFVAICRAIGIPAHIQKVDGSIEYYKGGEWVNRTLAQEEVQEPISAKLILVKEDNREWQYGAHYGISKLEEGIYKTLHLYDKAFQGSQIGYAIRPGQYRLMTCNRQIDGTIFARAYYFEVAPNEEKIMQVVLRKEDLKAHLKTVPFKIKELEDLKAKYNIVIWLELGKEPTEHILNEIREQKDRYNKLQEHVTFVIEKGQALEDVTLQKTLKEVSSISVLEVLDMSRVREKICRSFSVETEQLPLATVMTKDQKIKYACSGYNVGLADILLRIVEGLEDK